MFSWRAGIEKDFKISVGKAHKYLKQYMQDEEWERLMQKKFINVVDIWSVVKIKDSIRIERSSQFLCCFVLEKIIVESNKIEG